MSVQQPAELILASTSSYRRELLARLGVPFKALSPLCDETKLKAMLAGCSPEQLAVELAGAKADGLTGTVLSSDQVAALEDEVLDKSSNFERAQQQLEACSGRELRIITAVQLRQGERIWRHIELARLFFRKLSSAEITRYLKKDRPFDCAGAFKLEGSGLVLFERVETADYTGIIGLPLLAVARMLREAGYRVP
jgi:septum formation protein